MRKLIVGATGGLKVLAGGHEISNVTSVSLPEIEIKGEEMSGAGILGSFTLPTPGQFGAMTASVSQRTAGTDKKYLIGTAVNLEIRLAANMQTSDGAVIIAGTRIYMTGSSTKIGNGSAEVSKTRDESTEYSVTRYREVVDGEETLLIDQIAGMFKVGGVDMLAGLRSALG